METPLKPAVRLHSKKNTTWINASGDEVPVNFLTHADKLKEKLAGQIRKEALDAEKRLAALHDTMQEANAQVMAVVRDEYELKKGTKKRETKGNMTWYNFDGSIKVELNLNDIVKWDESLMNEAYKLFQAYIDGAIGQNVALVNKLISKAFANTKGCIDSRMVFQILKYEGQMNSSKYDKACELMRDAQRIHKTKTYYMVSERMEDGSYRSINLNFSSI